jgi:hypothetical protein
MVQRSESQGDISLDSLPP